MAKSPPATPAYAALIAEREGLVASEADAGGDGRRLGVADRAEGTPRAPAEDEPRAGEQHERDRPGEVVHPVVRRERAAEDVDVRDRAGELGRPEELDPLSAARELLEALHRRRHGDGDREGGEGEVETGEAQRREAEREPDEPGDEAGDRKRPEILHPARDRPAELLVAGHEDRGRVPADRHERAVAERDLARVPGEDVEAEERDEVDRDVRVLACLEVGDERRQHRDESDERRERDEADDALRAGRHTRFTSGLPKIPCGRMRRTARMMRSAIGRRSSSVNQLNMSYWLR